MIVRYTEYNRWGWRMKISYRKTTDDLILQMQSKNHKDWGETQYIDRAWFDTVRSIMKEAEKP